MGLTRRNLILIFSPVIAITAVDYLIKRWVVATTPTGHFWLFKFQVAANPGIVGGYFSGEATPLFQIPMVTLGFFLLACLYFIQLFAPVKSMAMRLAISIYFGGVFANVFDRLIRGYVVDYAALDIRGLSISSVNFADFCQLVGIGMLLVLQVRPSTYDENYAQKLWVSREFQKRYSGQLVWVGFFLMLVFGALSFTFLKVTLNEIGPPPELRSKLTLYYLIFFISTALTFLTFLYLIGRSLSAYVAKPMLSFERYLKSLSAGEYKVFQVDEPEFHYLERLSDEVRDHMIEMHLKLRRLENRAAAKRGEQ